MWSNKLHKLITYFIEIIKVLKEKRVSLINAYLDKEREVM